VAWDEQGQPQLKVRFDGKDREVAYADLLQQDGQTERAERLLLAVLAAMDHDARDLGIGDLWFWNTRPVSLALLGRGEQAIAQLQRPELRARLMEEWSFTFEMEPVFAPLRSDPRFQSLLADIRDHIAGQRALLQDLRRDGLVPARGATRATANAAQE
jgi:hypothetical protein